VKFKLQFNVQWARALSSKIPGNNSAGFLVFFVPHITVPGPTFEFATAQQTSAMLRG